MDGFLTQHMAVHIITMNAVAPVIALFVVRLDHPLAKLCSSGLGAALTLQLALLWGWHIPSVFALAHHMPVLKIAMHLSLFGCALWFWSAVFHKARISGWQSLSALLITGKLFCLLGVLLTFAPRPLYLAAAHGSTTGLLADQQLAGLLMLVACPLTYVLAAVMIAASWTKRMEAAPGWHPGQGAR